MRRLLVTMHRAVEELSTLGDAGAGGFLLKGSDSATVTTPPVYRAGASYEVTVRSRGAAMAMGGRVGASRRLTIEVPLGPSNRVQEFRPSADTKVYVARVKISTR